jgi:hypothetical protein
MKQITFLDTSVLCELLEVPGKCRDDDEVRIEFELRVAEGERFVIPITAVIETGNHIANANGDRWTAAQRLAAMVEAASADRPPFAPNQVAWDADFIAELLKGDSTERSFVDLACAGQLGAGDIAILVERDRYVKSSAMTRDRVRIWTLDARLGVFG